MIGLQYEYRLDKLFGIGGTIDYIGGDFVKWSPAFPFFFHPYAGWEFQVAPGLEIGRDETLFAANLGIGYEFELNEQWGLTPEHEATYADGRTFMSYGLSLNFRF